MTVRSMAATILSLLISSATFAQEAASPTKKMGWNPTANLGANAAVSSVSNVVGQTDGSSETYGLNLGSSFNFTGERSEWQNKASYNGSTTKTPALSRFVKASDLLKYEGVYLYSLESVPQLGPYARVSAEAPIFAGEDVRAADTAYNINRRDGSTSAVTASTLHLTDGLKPLTTKESFGVNWKALEGPQARIDVRLGIGAQQIAADGQLAVTGTAVNGTVSVSELRDISQLGVEGAVTAKGQIDTKTLWEAGLETLTPFVNNKQANDDRDAFRLTNFDGVAKLTSNVTSWASLTYSYKLQIKPQLVDRTQQMHLMVVNFNYNLL